MARSQGGCRAFTAQPAAEGFAVGRSLRVDDRGARGSVDGSPRAASLRDAVGRVRGDLQHLAGTLPRAEAELFEPEARILEEVAMRLLAREASGSLTTQSSPRRAAGARTWSSTCEYAC